MVLKCLLNFTEISSISPKFHKISPKFHTTSQNFAQISQNFKKIKFHQNLKKMPNLTKITKIFGRMCEAMSPKERKISTPVAAYEYSTLFQLKPPDPLFWFTVRV